MRIYYCNSFNIVVGWPLLADDFLEFLVPSGFMMISCSPDCVCISKSDSGVMSMEAFYWFFLTPYFTWCQKKSSKCFRICWLDFLEFSNNIYWITQEFYVNTLESCISLFRYKIWHLLLIVNPSSYVVLVQFIFLLSPRYTFKSQVWTN